MAKKYVSWRRVSTKRQGASGLGLDAQKEIIRYFIERDGGEWIADYEECYTGTDLNGCVKLKKAMECAKDNDAILIIAKTDRFRNTIEALQVYDKMGDGHIMFCDLPSTDKFTLTLFFALAEREALIVSIRTRQALAAKKERGEATGGACKKWRESYNNKSKEERKKEQMEKGKMKRERHHQSRDIQTFAKVIKKTFPYHCEGDDITKWEWMGITCRRVYIEQMLERMAEYKEIDPTLFRNFKFEDGVDANAQKMRSYMQAFKKSFGIVI